LSNANKFTQRGTIEVHTLRLPEHVLFIVVDHGPGMTSDQLGHLFKPFSQVHHDRKYHQHDGAGLGLAISKQIITMMNGHLSVVSETGRGSEFTVVLPLDTESPGEVSAEFALQQAVIPIQRRLDVSASANPDR
jgi:two-component system, sensor histidine kinase